MPYNIKFILFSGEEKYMLGSRWYVGNLSEDERKQIVGVINIDTIAEKSDLGYMAMIEGNKRPDDIEFDFMDDYATACQDKKYGSQI